MRDSPGKLASGTRTSATKPSSPVNTISTCWKSIYPVRRYFLDFQQVEIVFTGDDGFVAEVLVPEASFPGLSRISGRYRVADGHIASAVLC